MNFVGALILIGLLSYICATDSCYNKTDYDLYMMDNLVEDIQDRIKSLKQNVHAGIHTQCPNTTCSNITCADGWVSYKGSCYLFENGQLRNFQEARYYCGKFGAVLLYVRDEAENKFIVGMIERLKSSTHWFMGLIDQTNEGVWKWADVDVTTEYTKWSPGQPSGGTSENCACYVKRPPHSWHDTTCSLRWFSICKKRVM